MFKEILLLLYVFDIDHAKQIACLFPRRKMYLVIILDSVAFICV